MFVQNFIIKKGNHGNFPNNFAFFILFANIPDLLLKLCPPKKRKKEEKIYI